MFPAYRTAIVAIALSFVSTITSAGASVLPAATPAPVKCGIPKACAMFTNSSSGTALEGMAASGSGLTGISSSGAGLYGISISGLYYEPGVEGESANNDGSDAGGIFGANVLTTNVAPEYGVFAFGAGYGVVGEAESPGAISAPAYGVFGQDNTGAASSSGDFNIGVLGTSSAGTGVVGESNSSPANNGIYGYAPVGVYASANTAAGTPNALAFGIYVQTNSFGIDLHNDGAASTAFVLTPGDFFMGSSPTGRVTIDESGNELLSGTLTTSKGGPYIRSTGASGTTVMEYSGRTTSPQIDDVGEAQLANGRAYVNVDARLADTIDHRTAYSVFVTPEGDCNQLYVTRKTAAGFEVRESRGGRSTLAFAYRIVARPLGDDGARLAAAPPEPKPLDDGTHPGPKGRRMPAPPPSPEQRLKQRMGTQAYAEAMLRLRARQRALQP